MQLAVGLLVAAATSWLALLAVAVHTHDLRAAAGLLPFTAAAAAQLAWFELPAVRAARRHQRTATVDCPSVLVRFRRTTGSVAAPLAAVASLLAAASLLVGLPALLFAAGRACTVAGWTLLWHDLPPTRRRAPAARPGSAQPAV